MDRNPEVSSFLEEEERLAKFGRRDKESSSPIVSLHDFIYRQISLILFSSFSLELQKELCLEVGVNISDEFPWKLMKKEILEDYLTDNHPETEILRNKLNQMDSESVILVGYLSDFAEEGTFVVYDDAESARTASRVIEQLEALQRHRLKRRLTKVPGKWECLGSDKEVNEYAPRVRENMVNVQIQSIYPVRQNREIKLQQRLCDDARDGYVELVAGKKEFDNIYKSRIDTFIQCAPMKVHLEQQTDPTFPTNAWSQYIYVIERERREQLEAELKAKAEEDAEAEEEQGEEQEGEEEKVQEVKPIVLSSKMKEFLEALEFNQIDMYRNDYILARSKRLAPFKVPQLSEKFCFADITKTSGRRVHCIEWHPTLSGIFVASYTFDTPSVKISTADNTDMVNRIVLQPNYVLMWSFDNTLSPKLQLEAPREVSVLSFCPFDPTILVGGLINGQIIIWDLKDKLKECESEETLTPNQVKNRELMREFLRWTNTKHQYLFIRRALISSIDHSQQGQITGIRWLNSRHLITTGGQMKEDDKENRFFVTSSLDGTVAFWDLMHPERCIDRKTPVKRKQLNLPASISEGLSELAKYDRIYRPENMISVKKPISAMIFSDALFKWEPLGSVFNKPLTVRIPFRGVPLPPLKIEPRVQIDEEEEIEEDLNPLNFFHVSTSFGEIFEVRWKGHEADPQAVISRDQGNLSQTFASVHDGPIVALERNPFIPDVVLSIGTRVLAIWRTDTPLNPIYYRRRPATLVSAKWSVRRAAVFFVTRDDGDIEVWDLLNQTQSPTLVSSVGSQIVTTIVQQRLPLMQDVVAIGDFNSNIRILVIPPTLATATPDEVNLLDRLIADEIDRRRHLAQLQAEWFAANEDIIVAKRQLELEAREAEERRQRLARDQEDLRRVREEKEARRRALRDKKKITFDLPQQLNRKWDEMNLMRLMKMIMTMKKYNPDQVAQQIAPEKERLEYERIKKVIIRQSFAKIDEELIDIRRRLMPVQETLVDRRTLIKDLLEEILTQKFDYNTFQEETLKEISLYQKNANLSFNDIMARGRKSREVIEKSFGNTLHQDLYEEQKRFRHGIKKSTQDSASRVESSRASRRARSVTFPDDVKSEE
ncbi:dynein axonemal intermediate chain 3 [Phlebotomus argentipes]|uniref:dynein axonemal intermediate chain 3 n=1 Tax=Phlebotomus argentipes TaxID=94469 RepID=UPI0028936248|nr:dynein axonemal intermediate chain 3 [Phlebotomus argentipes]